MLPGPLPDPPGDHPSGDSQPPADPLLATILDTVTAPDGTGVGALSDDQLIGVIAAARRLESRIAWYQLAAVAEFTARAARLPRCLAALFAGHLHPVHLRIIDDETRILSAEHAAQADAALAATAGSMTFGKLRSAAHRLVLELDPAAAAKRQETARRDAHVRPFRESSGNAGMVARELPSAEVLASMQHVEQRALDLRAAGLPGTLQDLRVRAYLDLLQERDTRLDPPGPDLAAQVTITIPWSAWTGQSATPAEVDGFGPVDPADARDVADAAARDPRTRWCVTVLHPDGTAAAHGCAPGRHPPPPGPATSASPGPCLGPDPPAGPDPYEWLRSLRLTMTPIARGTCGHQEAEAGYQPSRRLRHLVRARNARCTAPGCARPAARYDLDHTLARDHGGLTCECDLAPRCNR